MASSLRDAPYAGLFVVFYEGIKREACERFFVSLSFQLINISARIIPAKSGTEAALTHSVSAAAAGAIATLATHPFDVIKVRSLPARMCNGSLKSLLQTKVQVRTEERYHGFFRTIGTVWKVCIVDHFRCHWLLIPIQQRGVAGFFDGASLRLSRKVLSSAIGWAVYEGVLMFMRTV